MYNIYVNGVFSFAYDFEKGESFMFNLTNAMPLAWDLGTFLQNATDTLKQWGGYLFVFLGVIAIIIGVYKIVKGLISHGQSGQPVNWLVSIGLIILGGVLIAGGFAFVSDIAQEQKKTIEDLGNGSSSTILPVLFR